MRLTISRVVSGALAVTAASALVFGGVTAAAFADTTPAPTGDDHTLGSSLSVQSNAATADAQQSSPSSTTQALPPYVPGMDVSGYQGSVDWSTAYSNGARFVYIKATESDDLKSSKFTAQWAGATSQGMIRGAYHFANPNDANGPTVQADFFVANGGTWAPDGKTLPPMVDLEGNTDSANGNYCFSLSPASMVWWIGTFVNRVYAQTGIRPVIYTTTYWWKTCTANSAVFSANPLFIANWTDLQDGPGTLPASWSSYTFWQHASDGTFPGDQDVFNGTPAQLTTFAAHATPDSNYITALYEDYLKRAPAPVESSGWEDHLASGSPRSAIADGFVGSDEYRLQRIDAAYQSILGRAPDGPGRLTWLNNMKAGRITTDDIETSLYSSQEYYQNNGGTDKKFVASLYFTLLHRQGSDADYTFWANLIAQNGRAWVVAQYWDDQETISQRVSAMYQLYLGRVPDGPGLQGWVNVALQIGDSGLRSGFTSSDEYYSRSQSRTF